MTGKIFRYVLLMSILVLILCTALFFALRYSQTKDEALLSLQKEAAYARNGVMLEGEDYLKSLDSKIMISWIDKNGNVIYDSKSGAKAENQSEYPEIKDALEKGEGSDIRKTESGDRIMYYATLCDDGSIIRLSDSLSDIWSAFMAISPVLWITVLVLFLSGMVAFRAAKQITNPINAIKVDSLESQETYPELSSLVNRIREQNLTIKDQIDELSRRQREFDLMTDNMSEGFALLDKEGIIISSNKSIENMISGFAIGANLTEIANENVREAVNEAIKGEKSDILIENVDTSLRLLANPVMSSSRITGVVLLVVDVSESVQREKLRREFSANVSHELKTPLTSISGFAELMMQDLVPPDKSKEFAKDIYRESARLISLINDIIKLSNLDEQEGHPDKEDIDLYAIAAEAVASLESAADAKGVKVFLDGEHAHIMGVPNFIDEMIYNLTDNAIKYNKDGGRVDIKITYTENSNVVLSVKDTGIGIPKENQGRVFERFYRAQNAIGGNISGTGLGLSIVKHVALLHNAQLSLDSMPGEGTTVTIVFPTDKNL